MYIVQYTTYDNDNGTFPILFFSRQSATHYALNLADNAAVDTVYSVAEVSTISGPVFSVEGAKEL
jgi:hypothetical protein